MSIENLTSFYPSYSILDEIVSTGSYKSINIFIDLKNVLHSLYIEDVVRSIVELSLASKKLDTSIFTSVLTFLIFHKKYALKRNIGINFFVFFESGRSSYHENISKKYKYSRKIDDLFGLDREKKEYFTTILQNNYSLVERVLNKIPNIHVVRLENFEADFIPYYLIRNEYVDSENAANIIYSTDHDLLQCLNLPDNNYVFSKTKHAKRVIRKGEVLKHYLDYENCPDDYLTLIMAIIGDKGDDVDGISGLGPKRTKDIIHELVNLGGSMNNIRLNALNGKKLFNLDPEKVENKNIRKVLESEEIISRNLKLVDFEIISAVIDDPPSTEILKKREYIESIFNDKKSIDKKILLQALMKTGVDIPEEVEILYQ